jgi:hypothetical protein
MKCDAPSCPSDWPTAPTGLAEFVAVVDAIRTGTEARVTTVQQIHPRTLYPELPLVRGTDRVSRGRIRACWSQVLCPPMHSCVLQEKISATSRWHRRKRVRSTLGGHAGSSSKCCMSGRRAPELANGFGQHLLADVVRAQRPQRDKHVASGGRNLDTQNSLCDS